jgi:hypothetical protein
MLAFDFTSATDPSKGNNFDPDFIAPVGLQSYPGDPAAIARGIFRDEIRDVLVVLKNCGALNTAAERRWCVEELTRLLDELGLC